MNLFAHLKIRDKLICGFASVVLFSCLIGFFGFKGMSEIKFRLDDMHSNLIPSILVIAEIEQKTQEYRRVYLRIVIEPRQELVKELETRLNGLEGKINDLLKQFEKFPLLPEERILLSRAKTIIADFIGATAETRKAIRAGARYDDQSEKQIHIRDLSEQMGTAVTQLLQFNRTEAEDHFKQSNVSYRYLSNRLISLTLLSALLAVSLALAITRRIVNPLQLVLAAVAKLQEGGKKKARLVEAIASGDLNQEFTAVEPLRLEADHSGQDESAVLLKAVVGMSETQHALDQAFVRMAEALRRNKEQETLQDWFKNGKNELNTILRGDKSTAELTEQALAFLAKYLGAGVGVLYIYDDDQSALQITASYALIRLPSFSFSDFITLPRWQYSDARGRMKHHIMMPYIYKA